MIMSITDTGVITTIITSITLMLTATITLMKTTTTITMNTGKNAVAAADMITGMTIMSMNIITIMQRKCLQAGAVRRQRCTRKKASRKF